MSVVTVIPQREPIMDALLAFLQDRCGAAFASYDKRFLMYDDLVQLLLNGTAPKFPALYLYDGVGFGGGITNWDQSSTQGNATPVKRTMNITIVIYALKPSANTPDGNDNRQTGGLYMYPLTEIVETAMASGDDPSYGVMRLGGLCRRCWIEGQGFLIPGDIDTNSGLTMQTIPVRILIP